MKLRTVLSAIAVVACMACSAQIAVFDSENVRTTNKDGSQSVFFSLEVSDATYSEMETTANALGVGTLSAVNDEAGVFECTFLMNAGETKATVRKMLGAIGVREFEMDGEVYDLNVLDRHLTNK